MRLTYPAVVRLEGTWRHNHNIPSPRQSPENFELYSYTCLHNPNVEKCSLVYKTF